MSAIKMDLAHSIDLISMIFSMMKTPMAKKTCQILTIFIRVQKVIRKTVNQVMASKMVAVANRRSNYNSNSNRRQKAKVNVSNLKLSKRKERKAVKS